MPHLEGAPAALGGRPDGVAVGDGEAQRLLAVDGKPGVERGHHVLAVQVQRRGDDHGVQIAPLEQGPVIGEGDHGTARDRCQLLEPLRVHVAGGGER